MIVETDGLPSFSGMGTPPETPHELLLDRGKIDDLVNRVRSGARVDLLEELLDAVDWSSFVTAEGNRPSASSLADLRHFYRQKWADIGPLYLAELLSTEFMTEQRARGDIVFSDRLLQLGRDEPNLWQEIRQFFRRKEMVTALLATANDSSARSNEIPASDEDEEDLWE